jgi:hypothetical protein
LELVQIKKRLFIRIVWSWNKSFCLPNSSNEEESVKENNKDSQRSSCMVMDDIGVDDNMLAEALGNSHVTISNIDDDHTKAEFLVLLLVRSMIK